VVPLRVGGGTRLKILEALALGTPVISSSKGAEGLDLVAGRDLLIADEPADFAAAVLRLLHEPALREMLSRNGRRAVEAAYDWPIIGQRFNDFIGMVSARAG
jgi:glycosyltransferase involved in cell wall biosynthesis